MAHFARSKKRKAPVGVPTAPRFQKTIAQRPAKKK